MIRFKGQVFTGKIQRQGYYAGGNSHFIRLGKILCSSPMNLRANDLSIAECKPSWAVYAKVLETNWVSCSKCNKKLQKLVTEHHENQEAK